MGVDNTSSISAHTQFVGDNINLHIFSIYWNAPKMTEDQQLVTG